MRHIGLFFVAVVLLVSAEPAAAQYGPGGGGGYGGGGYTPPTPGPSVPTPGRQNYRPPTSPHGGNPYGQPRTTRYPSQPAAPTYESQTVYEEYLYCTNCKKEVSDNSKAGDSCPHCGIYWSHDDKGNKAAGGGSGFSPRLGGLIAGVVVMVISLIVRALRS